MNKSCILIFCLVSIASHASVRLPKIFSDNIVLQRDVPVRIWGWEENSTVSVNFNGAAGQGEDKCKACLVHETIADVLIGDIWPGSGQSNMEWTVKNSNDADHEIANGNYVKNPPVYGRSSNKL